MVSVVATWVEIIVSHVPMIVPLTVDAALQRFGSARACTREDVEAAFAWLCSPNVGIAERDGDALIVRIDESGAVR